MSGPPDGSPLVRDIAYLIPGSLGGDDSASEELGRRSDYLRRNAPDGCRVSLVQTAGGPPSVESEAEEAEAARAVAREVPSLSDAGYEAVVVGCFGDPGVPEARERSRLHVVGPAEASFRAAGRSGTTFAVLTIVDDVVPLILRRVEATGMSGQLGSVLAVGMSVHDLRPNRDQVAARLSELGRTATRDGAEAVVLGCMSMGFLGLERELARTLDTPVVNPVLAALEAASRIGF